MLLYYNEVFSLFKSVVFNGHFKLCCVSLQNVDLLEGNLDMQNYIINNMANVEQVLQSFISYILDHNRINLLSSFTHHHVTQAYMIWRRYFEKNNFYSIFFIHILYNKIKRGPKLFGPQNHALVNCTVVFLVLYSQVSTRPRSLTM